MSNGCDKILSVLLLYLCQAGHLLIGMQHDVAMKVNCEESFFRKTYAGEHYRYSRASRAS